MSFLDSAKKSLEGFIKGQVTPAKPQTVDTAKRIPFNMDEVYAVDPSNWYSAKPYGFTFTTRDNKKVTMFLPINPSNLTIVTNFATNVIPTLYGTVEEHSEVRYYDISIEGTTGMAPKFVNPVMNSEDGSGSEYKAAYRSGRNSVPIAKGITGFGGGFFAKRLGALTQVANKAVDLLGGPSTERERGFVDKNSGYVAFHNLYRFLKKYKDDVSSGPPATRTGHPLQFFNYKDGNCYDVAIKNFSLRRSAESPMLYYYSIQLRGYNLRSTTSLPSESGLQQRVKDLGLDGVESSSFFSEFQKKSKDAKSVLSGLIGGTNLLGR